MPSPEAVLLIRGSTFGFLLLIPALLSCGEGGGTSGENVSALTPDLASQFSSVESCARLEGPLPEVQWDEAKACPTSGRLCCLEDVADFPCGDHTCGMNGAYLDTAALILLPEGCADAFRHEAVHHLLFVNGRPDWDDHAAPEFRCQ